MQAVILAAGMGKRLKDLTRDNTKCMVKVNGMTMIERALRILDKKKLTLTKEQAEQLYMMHKGKDFYDDLVKYMSSGECLCVKCYKECEDPIEEMDSLKDKVRDKWGKNDMKNAMHSSDSIENVKRESKIVFE